MAAYTWRGFKRGDLTMQASSEQEARVKVRNKLLTQHAANAMAYTAADLDFDLTIMAKTKPETED